MDARVGIQSESASAPPNLPGIALRVVELCNEREPNIDAIAQVLESDSTLSAKMLRVVNSAAFGLRHEVETIRAALAFLGLNSVRALALSASLARMHEQRPMGFQTCWKRSALAAVAAKELSIALRLPNADEGFLAALLQDVGAVALGHRGADSAARLGGAIDDDAGAALARARHLREHAEAGARLAAKWNLPARFVFTVRWSQDPAAAPRDSKPEELELARLVSVAGLVADIWLTADPGRAAHIARRAARELLAATDSSFDAVLSAMTAKSHDVAEFLDVSLGSRDELIDVMQRAREALVMLSAHARQSSLSSPRAADKIANDARELGSGSIDESTGLANRRGLDAVLDARFAEAQRSGRPLSIALVEIGDGPQDDAVRDRALVEVGALLARSIRPTDFVARFSSVQFAILLPGAELSAARAASERLRRVLAAHAVGVHVSFGTATYAPLVHATASELAEAAGIALAVAVQLGGDRVVASGEIRAGECEVHPLRAAG